MSTEIIGLLVGTGWLFLACSFSYFIISATKRGEENHQLCKSYNFIEEVALHKVADKIGLNVTEHEAKARLSESKSFREAIEEKMVKDLITENKGVKK
jgi:hypothetical protein